MLVLTVLGGAHGLRLSTNPESDVKNARPPKMAHMSIGTNARLQALKAENDILDAYIMKHANKMALQNKSRLKSWKESDGFFEEADELWAKRKARHINQMNMQNLLMTTCPDGFWEGAKQCLVGCAGENADCAGSVFWQTHYEPSFSCALEERVGMQGEGGKWVCDPHKIQEKDSCLVYSIGSNGQYDFEESVHKHISSKCEIHTVDVNSWTAYTSTAPPEYVTYHVNKIGPEPDTPVSTLVRELGHTGREIDLFKIDCEGCEWDTYASWFGENINIRQVLVEIHGTGGGRGAHNFFNFLFDKGYVVFHKEPNTLGCGGACLEYAFVRLSPTFSRASNAALS